MQQPGSCYVHPTPSGVHVHLAPGVIVLRYPCWSSMLMLECVQPVAAGPEVLAIKQTLYRTKVESLLVGTTLRRRGGARDASAPRGGQFERNS